MQNARSKHRIVVALVAMLLVIAAMPRAFAGERDAVVYKSPWCGCCGGYVEYLRANGYSVVVKDFEDMDPIKKLAGVPEPLQACHTMMIGGYVVEGHVPLESVAKLLAEKPRIRGISLPGMPEGVPGMPGPRPERIEVVTLSNQPVLFDVR